MGYGVIKPGGESRDGTRAGLALGRRAVILAAGGLAVAAADKAAPKAAVVAQPDFLGALRARVDALGGNGLLQSYDVLAPGAPGAGAFDQAHRNCAYVYDNALAGMALLLAGDITRARRLGDALGQAQASDRFYKDGRLRNAYRAGPAPTGGSYPLPGWWDAAERRWVEDAYHASSATGVVAWAMMLWLALDHATGGPGYLAFASGAADWVERTQGGTNGFRGGTIGFEPAPAPVAWVSTEHNVDLACAFAALGRRAEAAHARDFVAGMWSGAERRYYDGLRPDGAVNAGSALDANLWPALLAGADPQRSGLDWVLANHAVPAGDPAGVDFNTDRDGIWLEGTAFTALSLRRAGRADLATSFMATVASNTAPGGLVYASTVPKLTTGLSTGINPDLADFYYYRRPHIAPTAWAALAMRGWSPLG